MKPRIVQALCGPLRHCIVALAYVPGITTAQADFGSCDDVTLTEANAAGYLQKIVDGLIARQSIDPWCVICHAGRRQWVFVDELSRFESLEEAQPFLRESERRQAEVRDILRRGKN